jgi:hypothetical protein
MLCGQTIQPEPSLRNYLMMSWNVCIGRLSTGKGRRRLSRDAIANNYGKEEP